MTGEEDKADSDPIGGIAIPAVLMLAALQALGSDAAAAMAARIRAALAPAAQTGETDTGTAVVSTENTITPIISDKIESQIAERGWTQDSVLQTIDQPYTTRVSINRATGNAGTAYYNSDGSYVVVDDVTKEIVQVSDRLDLNWIPDKSIKNPYKP